LYYGTGVGVGLLASFLILIFIVGRFIPGRKAGLVFLVTGGSLFLAGVQYLWQTHVLSLLESYYEAYFVLSALLTFIFLYWYGPPTNPRTLDIVQWAIQVCGEYTTQYTLHSIHYIVYTTQYTHYTVYTVYTLHSIQYTLHSTHYTT